MAERAEPTEARVAVYIDFDNVVISRYDQVHGRDAWRKDEARRSEAKSVPKLEQARVDIGAILDYASSFGTVALSRAYADWSVPANAAYKRQLVDRAIDLTQLFPASSTKNGADIRLAVDVIDDMFRLPDITHVVIVAGDSDYIPLAQRCKRLGRVVVGIGVAGSTSPALVAALDEFESYDALDVDVPDAPVAATAPTKAPADGGESTAELTPAGAAKLLVRAITLGRGKQDDDEWLNASTVKSQLKRLNPSFNEKALGFRSFMDFVRAQDAQVEIREAGQQRFMRLRVEATDGAPAAEQATAPAKKTSRRAGTKATTPEAATEPEAATDTAAEAEVETVVEKKPAARAPRRARSEPTATDPFREP
jgi:uncharacterized LabA/DUF88 family protein